MLLTSQILLLISGWAIWCALHSLLISHAASRRLQSLLGPWQYHFRLAYNLFSIVTLLPMMAVTAFMRGGVVFSWSGSLIIIRFLLISFSLWLFAAGARQYDMSYMLGLHQIRQKRQQLLLANNEQFSTRGVHGVVRHPWYLGSLLLLWSALPVYHQSSVVAVVVLSIYLIVGTLLEERKLMAEYGEDYASYQREVSMLIPLKWLMTILKRGKK